MEDISLRGDVLRTLLYFDIFSYPLRLEEIFIFLPRNSITKDELREAIERCNGQIASKEGYFYVNGKQPPLSHFDKREHQLSYVSLRQEREHISRRHWRIAKFMTHIIKRCPFVRCVLVTGSLSKNSSDKNSDLDFMVITKPGRLWISRTLLMLFKKIFLFNSYKYFCINFFLTEDNLESELKNIYTATEIATVKPTYNDKLMKKFLDCNNWIERFFPNSSEYFSTLHHSGLEVNNRQSYMQKFLEIFFAGKPGDKLNEWFRKLNAKYTRGKYKSIGESDWKLMFESSQGVSKTFPGNMQRMILEEYERRLRKYDLV
jgi:predicted nucleotidyltransferase